MAEYTKHTDSFVSTTKCAIITPDDIKGIYSLTVGNNEANMVKCFDRYNIYSLNPKDFDIMLFVGNSNDINSDDIENEFVRIINDAFEMEKPIGFAGDISINSLKYKTRINEILDSVESNNLKLEFISRKYIDCIEYIIDPQNKIVSCTSYTTAAIQELHNEMVQMINDETYLGFSCDSNQKAMYITINNSQYRISHGYDFADSQDFNFDPILKASNDDKYHKLTDKQLKYIQHTFFKYCESKQVSLLIGNYDIYFIESAEPFPTWDDFDENKPFLSAFNENDFYGNEYSKVGDFNCNDYHVLDFIYPGLCATYGDLQRMSILNWKLKRKSDCFEELIGSKVMKSPLSPGLIRVIKKYQQKIENVINNKQFKEIMI